MTQGVKPSVWIAVIACVLFSAVSARAEVALPNIFSDGMVLQRGESVPVYGTAAKGEAVTVEFRGKTAKATAKGDKWLVNIPTGEPGGPFTLTAKGRNAIAIKNVYVGDVWVASGQSNMHMTANFVPLKEAPESIRFFTGVAAHKSMKQHGIWQTRGHFSSFGNCFAVEVYRRTKVPVGMIYAAVGGTGIARWGTEPHKSKRGRVTANDCYLERIKPLMPYRIKGVIWWQGESDSAATHNRYNYHGAFEPMITGWRKEWDQGDFPFLWVQLSSITKRACIGETRDAMRRALAMPKTGMAVSFDLTNGDLVPLKKRQAGSLHPAYCYPGVAKRLALAARAVAYGEKDLVWSGPLFEKGALQGNRLVLSFAQLGGGLVAKGDREPGTFEVQENAAGAKPGDAGEFKAVKAALGGEKKTVVLDVTGLKPPLRVRYAYGDMPKGNLYNTADLPASPFISDPIPAR